MKTIERRLAEYTGLIKTTARMLEGRVEGMALDDIEQRFTIKVWRALLTFDAKRSGALPEKRYVFMCVTSEKIDLLKRVRRGELGFDDLRAPRDDSAAGDGAQQTGVLMDRLLMVSEEEAFAGIETEPLVLPSTLTPVERLLVGLLYVGYKQAELAAELGVARGVIQELERSIRAKLEDWRPSPRPAHPLAGRQAPVEAPTSLARAA